MSSDDEVALIAAACRGDHDAFRRLTEPFGRELRLHCYRMMGSLHDAEDLVQETLFRAWRRLDSFEGRSTFRSWLYRIATNACLDALDRRRHEAPRVPHARWNGFHAEAVPHLEPYPDVLVDGLAHLEDGDLTPEGRYELRESISLAFEVAIQLLPPRQRAALILRDALGYSARETADLMGATVASVNSALQRARTAVQHNGRHDNSTAPRGAADRMTQQLVERFVRAWEREDISALVGLLTDDAVLTMPPLLLRLVGREAIAEFFSTVPAGGRLRQIRLVVTAANAQPALAAYLLDPATGSHHAYGLTVLTVGDHAISAITVFADPSLVGFFGLDSVLPTAE